jgi:alpha-D-xyloside xylohydrolase
VYPGDSLLVTGPAHRGGRSVYLPAGDWVDVFTGDRLSGPMRTPERSWPAEHFPLYVRAGARIPVYPHEVQCTDEMELSRTVELVADETYTGLAASVLGQLVRP